MFLMLNSKELKHFFWEGGKNNISLLPCRPADIFKQQYRSSIIN